MKQIILLFSILLIHQLLTSQTTDHREKPTMYKGCNTQVADSSSILNAFKQGQLQGHFRYYFMHTNNMNRLTDYFANAAGGGIKYESAIFHHFQFGISGFYVFNIGSSKLNIPDSATSQTNRYEIGLFDIENPNNRKDIDRLEELYLNYRWKKGWGTFGRQLINTPFINLQDGRMRPTGVEGVTFVHKINAKHKLQGGVLYAISPRSSTKWFSVGNSIGIYPQGLTTSGKKSDYEGHLNSDWVAYLDYQAELGSKWHLQVHHLTIDRLITSNMLQLDFELYQSEKQTIKLAGQSIRQDALTKISSSNSNSYTHNGACAMTFGFQVTQRTKNWNNSINYTRITKDGRYLMPREWGRDPFFTFIPRERNEGYGDVHAFAIKTNYTTNSEKWKFGWAAGYYQLPDVKNSLLNKYGMPSYLHSNLEAKYTFGKKWEGLEAHLLFMAKYGIGATYNNWVYVQNKVNMGMINFILNYHF